MTTQSTGNAKTFNILFLLRFSLGGFGLDAFIVNF
jgi:hypothetical protein